MTSCFVLVVISAQVSLSTCHVWAQQGMTSVRGTVIDPQSRAIAGALVVLEEKQRGLRQETTTNASGTYEFLQISPGSYRIVILASGFKSQSIDDLAIQVASPETFNVRLSIYTAFIRRVPTRFLYAAVRPYVTNIRLGYIGYMTNRLAAIALILIYITGCGGGAGGGSGSAKLRVLNAQTGGSLNVVVDGTTVVTNDQYPMCVYEICQTLSEYVAVKSGGVSFALTTPPDTTNLVPTQFQELKLTGDTQTTFVFGPPMTFSNNAPYTGFLFADDDVPAANSVKIRIANVYPSGPASLSAFILPEGTMPSGNPTLNNIALGSASDYVTVPPGSHTVWFVVPAKTLGTPPSPYTSWGPTTYPANQNFTVYLIQESDTNRAVILADN